MQEAVDLKLKKKKDKEDSEIQARRVRKIKKGMGLIKYYLCPLWRKYYDPFAGQIISEDEKRRREEEAQVGSCS